MDVRSDATLNYHSQVTGVIIDSTDCVLSVLVRRKVCIYGSCGFSFFSEMGVRGELRRMNYIAEAQLE